METSNSCFSLANRNGGVKKIQFSDILYLEGSINYTLIHLANGKVMVSSRTLLFHIEQTLDDSFIRIHRSFCVNKAYIKSFVEDFDTKYVLLEGNVKLSISRHRGRNIKLFVTEWQTETATKNNIIIW